MTRQGRTKEPASENRQNWILFFLGLAVAILGTIYQQQSYMLAELRGQSENIKSNTLRIEKLESNHQPQPWPSKDYQPPREALPKEDRRKGLRPEDD